MKLKSSSLKNILGPSYLMELGLNRELDPEIVSSGIRSLRNRFPGMKFEQTPGCKSSFRTDVSFVLPTDQLRSMAFQRGLSTTELLASLMTKAQEAAFDSDFFQKGSRCLLYVCENPSRLSSFVLHGSKRRSYAPALRWNSRTFCDLGDIHLSDELSDAVRCVDFRAVRQPGRGSACTAFNFGGRTTINCSRRIREHKFEYFFYEELRAAGLDVTVEPSLRQQTGRVVTVAYSAL